MDDAQIKTLVTGLVSSSLKDAFNTLETNIKIYVDDSIGGLDTRFKAHDSTDEITKKAKDGSSSDAVDPELTKLRTEIDALKSDSAKKDASLLRQRILSELVSSATGLGAKSPALLAELILTRANSKEGSVKVSDSGVTIDGKSITDTLTAFVDSTDGTVFRPSKDVGADKPNEQSNQNKPTDKSLWDAFVGTF